MVCVVLVVRACVATIFLDGIRWNRWLHTKCTWYGEGRSAEDTKGVDTRRWRCERFKFHLIKCVFGGLRRIYCDVVVRVFHTIGNGKRAGLKWNGCARCRTKCANKCFCFLRKRCVRYRHHKYASFTYIKVLQCAMAEPRGNYILLLCRLNVGIIILCMQIADSVNWWYTYYVVWTISSRRVRDVKRAAGERESRHLYEVLFHKCIISIYFSPLIIIIIIIINLA